MFEIAPYTPQNAQAVKDISLSWLEPLGLLEQADLDMLNDLEGQVLAQGGHILMALWQGSPCGVVMLLPTGRPGEVELLKFGVAPGRRGRGVGRELLRAALARARDMGARRVTLCTNHRLRAAIHLYQQLGFEETPYEPGRFALSDQRMELDLEKE